MSIGESSLQIEYVYIIVIVTIISKCYTLGWNIFWCFESYPVSWLPVRFRAWLEFPKILGEKTLFGEFPEAQTALLYREERTDDGKKYTGDVGFEVSDET
jgi:hypothetical protein